MSRRGRRPVRKEESSEEEAKEVAEEVEEESNPNELSESEGEDLIDNAADDYARIKELDQYEREGLDDQDYDNNPEARRKAERAIRRREAIRRGEPFDEYLEDESEGEEEDRALRERRRMIYAEDDDIELIDENRYGDPEEVKGKLHEWIREDETVRYIKKKFKHFLKNFKDENEEHVYTKKIMNMCYENKQSLFVSYEELKTHAPTLAMWVAIEPAIIIPQLSKILFHLTKLSYPSYANNVSEVFVRFYKIPISDTIQDLRFLHLGKLVRIRGVITVRSEIFSQLKKVFYKCGRCAATKGPYYINNVNDITIGACNSCQSKGPFTIERKKTVFRNFQKMTIQQSPSEVMAGRIPRSKQFVLFGDITDSAKPGEEVEVVGIYLSRYDSGLNAKHGFPLLSTMIEVNNISHMSDIASKSDAYDEGDMLKLAKSKHLEERIFNSIAPSIYGHDMVKKALTLALFGGVEQTPTAGHRIRGDINVLLLGDPGIAKSQFLKSVHKVFHRCVYTTGKGASAVGLTACVRQDFQSREWKLEAGALVLADKGICLIDEFDKMSEYDRTSIHEAMEQQSISISKAGIVTSLRARCSVIAAANPVQGRYDSQRSFSDNVELTEPILSRFDMLCVMKDVPEEHADSNLSAFVINSHMTNHPYYESFNLEVETFKQAVEGQTNSIPLQLLSRYIKYAREKCFPKLEDARVTEKLKKFYGELREKTGSRGGIKIGTRHLESMIRMATARAKMYLRKEVNLQDADLAIQMMLHSAMQSLKHSQARKMQSAFDFYLR